MIVCHINFNIVVCLLQNKITKICFKLRIFLNSETDCLQGLYMYP